jgi:chromosome segregation ATPase
MDLSSSSTSDTSDDLQVASHGTTKERSYSAIIHFTSATGILLSVVLVPYAVMRRRLSLVEGELRQLTKNVESLHQELSKIPKLTKELEQSRRLLDDMRCTEDISAMRGDILRIQKETEKYGQKREQTRRLLDAVGQRMDLLQGCSSAMEDKIQAIGDRTDAMTNGIAEIRGKLEAGEQKSARLEAEMRELLDERR